MRMMMGFISYPRNRLLIEVFFFLGHLVYLVLVHFFFPSGLKTLFSFPFSFFSFPLSFSFSTRLTIYVEVYMYMSKVEYLIPAHLRCFCVYSCTYKFTTPLSLATLPLPPVLPIKTQNHQEKQKP